MGVLPCMVLVGIHQAAAGEPRQGKSGTPSGIMRGSWRRPSPAGSEAIAQQRRDSYPD